MDKNIPNFMGYILFSLLHAKFQGTSTTSLERMVRYFMYASFVLALLVLDFIAALIGKVLCRMIEHMALNFLKA
jgi:hypothetical protein